MRKKGYKQSQEIFFSLIMPTYNRKNLISKAIDSVIHQDYKNFELIIVDDGSSDGTENYLLQKYASYFLTRQFRYIRLERSGVSAARNKGLQEVSYEWIAYIDSDNEIVPEFLSVFADAICKFPDKKAFYARWKYSSSRREKEFVSFDYEKLIKHNFIDLGVYVHHIEIYHEIGGFDTSLKRLVDWDLIIRYSQKYKPQGIDKIVLIYNDDDTIERITMNVNYSVAHNAIMKRYGNNFTISTIIISYNQEKYIAEAIESALMQYGGFIHEILLADDASTDRTPQILKEYAERYPEIIKDISSPQNLGISENYKRAFAMAKGKYIAILEGDDYWLSKHKLEKQSQLLEKYPNLKMAFSSLKVLNNNTGEYIRSSNPNLHKNILTYRDFLKDDRQNLIVNFSCCMFKKSEMLNLPSELYKYRLSEISLAFYFTRHGKIGYIDEPLSVYRSHDEGVWSGLDSAEKLLSGYYCRKTALKVANSDSKIKLYEVLRRKYIPELLNTKCISQSEVKQLQHYILYIKIGRFFSFIPRLFYKGSYYFSRFVAIAKSEGLKTAKLCVWRKLFGNIFDALASERKLSAGAVVRPNIINPNLVINSDFQINDRKRKVYKKGYTVNRWRLFEGILMYNKDCTITLYSDDELETENKCFLRQYIENASDYVNKKMTLSCRIGDIKGMWYMQFSGSTKKRLDKSGVFSVTATAASNFSDIRFFTHDKNASLNIFWVKLEQSASKTLYQKPDGVEEILKCARYNFFIRKGDIKRMDMFIGNKALFNFALPMPLVTLPKLRYDKRCYKVKTIDGCEIDGTLSVFAMMDRNLILAFEPKMICEGLRYDLILCVEKDMVVDAEKYN